MAMTLTKIEGEEKLSLFYVELRNKKGELQNIQINRLKEKLGTKALPTAELTLQGTPAKLVGESGKGVKTIATLFNITRLYNACCSIGYMRRGIALSTDYAHKRVAFGKKLIDHDLHALTLVNLEIRFEASFLLTFEAIRLLGKEECGKASLSESRCLRLLIPLVKLFTAKEGVAIASEVVESFGGAGYVEDTHIPEILRNAQVLAIWEGTTNVLSLDVLRAMEKEDGLIGFTEEINRRLHLVSDNEEAKTIKNSLLEITNFLNNRDPEMVKASARPLAMKLARTFAAALLLEKSQWENQKKKSHRTHLVLKEWLKLGLGDLSEIDQKRMGELKSLLK